MNTKYILGPVVLIAFFLTAPSLRADHPSNNFKSLVPVAHKLEVAAQHVHKAAERQAHHGNRREAYALGRLHRLNQAAAHFHDEAEKYYSNPRHTEKDFRVLVNAYYEARSGMRGLHAFDHVQDDFSQVSQLMRRLVSVYSRYGEYYPRSYRGYGDNHRYGSRHDDGYYDDDDHDEHRADEYEFDDDDEHYEDDDYDD